MYSPPPPRMYSNRLRTYRYMYRYVKRPRAPCSWCAGASVEQLAARITAPTLPSKCRDPATTTTRYHHRRHHLLPKARDCEVSTLVLHRKRLPNNSTHHHSRLVRVPNSLFRNVRRTRQYRFAGRIKVHRTVWFANCLNKQEVWGC